ncbi:MAG: hypothetical protein WBO24_13890, partial [Nitrospirales bacterium]
ILPSSILSKIDQTGFVRRPTIKLRAVYTSSTGSLPLKEGGLILKMVCHESSTGRLANKESAVGCIFR